MDNLPSHAMPQPTHRHQEHRCAPVPEFTRLKYAYGQLLSAADFQGEQDYFREKLRLHNRCLHGYGVVCGLLVCPVPPPHDCMPDTAKLALELQHRLAAAERAREAETDDQRKAVLDAEIEQLRQQVAQHPVPACLPPPPPVQVTIGCGVAIDCRGDELVVRRPILVDLWAELSAEERKKIEDCPATLYVSLCYCEQPADPFRPVIPDQCGAAPGCAYGKLRETVRVRVSLTRPEPDTRCETCCASCDDCCLLLAEIHEFRHGHPLEETAIHNWKRRRIGPYEPVVITGINWVHGASYLRHDAEAILGTDEEGPGLQFRLSRPVRVDSLHQRGVIELWRIEGGKGRSGYLSEVRGRCHPEHVVDGMTQRFHYRQTDREALDYGDRIIILVRSAFILDACCRPIDGANVGGRVPLLPGSRTPHRAPAYHGCETPPWGYGPWTSGNGLPGSSFESWIVVSEKEDHPHEGYGRQSRSGAAS